MRTETIYVDIEQLINKTIKRDSKIKQRLLDKYQRNDFMSIIIKGNIFWFETAQFIYYPNWLYNWAIKAMKKQGYEFLYECFNDKLKERV